MTVMEMLRARKLSAQGVPEGTPVGRHLLSGAATALASSLAVVLPALLVWVAAAESTVAWTDALGVGASLWLLVQGAHLIVGAAHVELVPLLALALAVTAGAWGAVRALRETAETCAKSPPPALLARPLAVALAAWTLGYAGCAAAWAAVAFATGPAPEPWTLVLPLGGVPVLSAVFAGLQLARARPRLAGPGLREPSWLPQSLRRAVRPALWGVGGMLALGMAICAALLALRFEEVLHLQGRLSPGPVGGAALALAQVLALPNLALWAVSFVAGTGFSVIEGASATWTGSRSGLLPMVPVLSALPEPGAFPGLLPAVALLPVAVGALIGWRSLKSVARLSTARTKLTVTAVAVALAAGGLGALDAVAGGSLGAARLSDVGAPAGAMSLALLVEFSVGAALVLLWDRWRLRR